MQQLQVKGYKVIHLHTYVNTYAYSWIHSLRSSTCSPHFWKQQMSLYSERIKLTEGHTASKWLNWEENKAFDSQIRSPLWRLHPQIALWLTCYSHGSASSFNDKLMEINTNILHFHPHFLPLLHNERITRASNLL